MLPPTPCHSRPLLILSVFPCSDSRCVCDDRARVFGDQCRDQSCLPGGCLVGGLSLRCVHLSRWNLMRDHSNPLRIGIYLCLSIAAFPKLARNHTLKSLSASVFFVGNVLMFVLVSVTCSTPFSSPTPFLVLQQCQTDCLTFSGLVIFDTVLAFAYQADVEGPIRPFNHSGYWFGAISMALLAGILMLADVLMVSLHGFRFRPLL